MNGTGEVVLTSGETGIEGDGLLTLADCTIRGSGRVNVSVTNAGTLFADSASGDLDLEGSVALTTNSVLAVNLDGSNFSQSGRLDFELPISLNGELKIVVGDNFSAAMGAQRLIIVAPEIISTFAEIDQLMAQSLTNGFVFDVVYNPTDVSVVVTDIFLLADINLDGQVNLLDVQPFVELITSGQFQREGDLNGDGQVNLLDVAPFVNLLTGG